MSIFDRFFGERPAAGPRTWPKNIPSPQGEHTLVLYQYAACPFCQRVLREIDTLKLGKKVELRDTMMDPNARTLLRERTGRTQVPCLFIDGQPLFESSDISAWLKEYAAA